MFRSVVAGAFQITFRAKIDVFLFLKIIFDISTSKRFKIYKPLNFNKEKKFQIFWERGLNRVPKRFLNDLL